MRKIYLTLALCICSSSFCFAQKVIETTPQTFQKAMTALRNTVKNQKEDIVMLLHGGEYELSAPLVFDNNLSGKNGHTITLKAAQGETPIISGGRHVTGWQRIHGNLWKTNFNSNVKLRTLIVNGKRARMAGSRNLIQGLGAYGIIDITGNEPWAFGAGQAPIGIKMQAGAEMAAFRNPQDVELVQNNVWNEKVICVSDMQKWGDTIAVELQQPISAILTTLKWAGKTNFDRLFFVRNALELLDEPGEFYFDRSAKTLYYYSNGEDMTKANVIAPQTEGLIKILGKDNAQQAGNICFEGLTFSYDAWNLMPLENSRGFGGIQSLGLALKYIPDGNWHPTKYNSCDVPDGTIEVRNAKNVKILRNKFLHLASATAINLDNDDSEIDVTGNVFCDLLGNIISVGHPQHYEIGDGEGRFAKGVEGLCHDIRITNNYARNICLDFRQLEAMLGFFVKNVKYDHNDIAGTPYGCVALGWWWGNAAIPESTVAGNNSISYNSLGHSHQVLTDGGIIYMLGRQPGSVCEGNYLYNGPRCIYPDDGSSGWAIRKNFINSLRQMWLHIDSDRDYEITVEDNYVKDNYLKNSGKGVEVVRTHKYRNIPFDEEALAIQHAAGIEPAYRDIIPNEEPEPIKLYIEMAVRKIQ